jgi:transposase InsO family protein
VKCSNTGSYAHCVTVERNHSCYGYRRLRASLGRQHVFISEKVVPRLMRQEGLIVPAPKRRRYGSYLGEISPAPDNHINRDFQAATPNEKWLTDRVNIQAAPTPRRKGCNASAEIRLKRVGLLERRG